MARLHGAVARHRQRLIERQAWTCKPVRIERTIPPTEPAFVHAAKISTNWFKDWLDQVDALWVVHVRCADGRGVFVVTGARDRDTGTTKDRILVAALGPRT
jgi:hypothetical protein